MRPISVNPRETRSGSWGGVRGKTSTRGKCFVANQKKKKARRVQEKNGVALSGF